MAKAVAPWALSRAFESNVFITCSALVRSASWQAPSPNPYGLKALMQLLSCQTHSDLSWREAYASRPSVSKLSSRTQCGDLTTSCHGEESFKTTRPSLTCRQVPANKDIKKLLLQQEIRLN